MSTSTFRAVARAAWRGVAAVLMTAGASAPEVVVQECLSHLEQEFGAVVDEVTTREEHVTFPLPRELRLLQSDV